MVFKLAFNERLCVEIMTTSDFCGINCKINLIPFNEYPGSPYLRPTEHKIARFQSRLRGFGFDVFVRNEKGDDILGACGQLGTPVT